MNTSDERSDKLSFPEKKIQDEIKHDIPQLSIQLEYLDIFGSRDVAATENVVNILLRSVVSDSGLGRWEG